MFGRGFASTGMSTASFGTPLPTRTPTLGFATQVVSVTVLGFFLLIGFVFWITSLHDRPEYVPSPETVPEGVPHTGGHVVLGGALRHQPSAVTEMRSLSPQDIEGRTRLS